MHNYFDAMLILLLILLEFVGHFLEFCTHNFILLISYENRINNDDPQITHETLFLFCRLVSSFTVFIFVQCFVEVVKMNLLWIFSQTGNRELITNQLNQISSLSGLFELKQSHNKHQTSE